MYDSGAGDGGLGEIIDAAIEADLQHNGWHKYSGDGLMRIFAAGAHAVLTPATGSIEIRNISEPAEQEVEAAVKDAERIYAKWPSKIEQAFAKWVELPTNGFNTSEVAWLENAEGEIRTGAVSPTDTDGSSSTSKPPIGLPNQRLASDLNNLDDRMGKLNGLYAETFKEMYVSPLPVTIQSLGALIACLALACRGQGAIWEAATEDLEKVKKQAAAAMKASAPGGGGSIGPTVLAVGGAIAGLIAAIPTGGASIVGVATLIGAGAGLVKEIDGASGSSKKVEVQLGASTPDGVLDNINAALTDLSAAIRGQEEEIRNFLSNVHSETTSHREAFDLMAPRAERGNVLDRQQDVSVDAGTIANITELWIPTICGDLRAARGELVVTSRVFSTRPSGVGLVQDGAWPEFEKVQDVTVELLTNMVRDLEAGADALNDAARTIGLQDQEIAAEARRKSDEINATDNDFVTLPTPHGSSYPPIVD